MPVSNVELVCVQALSWRAKRTVSERAIERRNYNLRVHILRNCRWSVNGNE